MYLYYLRRITVSVKFLTHIHVTTQVQRPIWRMLSSTIGFSRGRIELLTNSVFDTGNSTCRNSTVDTRGPRFQIYHLRHR